MDVLWLIIRLTMRVFVWWIRQSLFLFHKAVALPQLEARRLASHIEVSWYSFPFGNAVPEMLSIWLLLMSSMMYLCVYWDNGYLALVILLIMPYSLSIFIGIGKGLEPRKKQPIVEEDSANRGLHLGKGLESRQEQQSTQYKSIQSRRRSVIAIALSSLGVILFFAIYLSFLFLFSNLIEDLSRQIRAVASIAATISSAIFLYFVMTSVTNYPRVKVVFPRPDTSFLNDLEGGNLDIDDIFAGNREQ